MPETRARKQDSVLSRVSSVMLKANNLVIEVSSTIFSDSITRDALHSFADRIRSLYSHVSESLSDLCEFCDDENQTPIPVTVASSSSIVSFVDYYKYILHSLSFATTAE